MLSPIHFVLKDINCHYSDFYWRTSIKDTIKWFTFLTIIEHTTNIMKTGKGMIPSMLMALKMFELRLIGDKEKMDVISIRCIKCNKNRFLFTKYKI